jgi:hypothetical protein
MMGHFRVVPQISLSGKNRLHDNTLDDIVIAQVTLDVPGNFGTVVTWWLPGWLAGWGKGAGRCRESQNARLT